MIKNKKAQLALITVFVIIFVLGLILFSSNSRLEAYASIGLKQTVLTKAYSEGEAAREYAKTSARLIAYEQFKESGCPVIDKNKLYENMQKYLEIYASPNENFTTTFPSYIYEVTIGDNEIKIAGIPSGNINIYSAQYKFNYSVSGYFSETITCKEFEYFRGKQNPMI